MVLPTDPFEVTARAAHNATARHIMYTHTVISTSPIFHFLRGRRAITIATKAVKSVLRHQVSSSSVHSANLPLLPCFPIQRNPLAHHQRHSPPRSPNHQHQTNLETLK